MFKPSRSHDQYSHHAHNVVKYLEKSTDGRETWFLASGCSNDDLGLTFTSFTAKSMRENTNTCYYMESFEDFGLKLVIIRFVLMST